MKLLGIDTSKVKKVWMVPCEVVKENRTVFWRVVEGSDLWHLLAPNGVLPKYVKMIKDSEQRELVKCEYCGKSPCQCGGFETED